MSTREIKAFKQGQCPACGGKQIYEGPSGGGSQNVFCSNPKCQAGWNLMLTPYGLMGGQLIRDPVGGDNPDPLTMPEEEKEAMRETPTGGARDRDMLRIYGIVSFTAGMIAVLGLVLEGWIIIVFVFFIFLFWYFIILEAYKHFGVRKHRSHK